MYDKMAEFNKCCSADESKLAYPRFSAVFLQTFCIHDSLRFVVPEDAVLDPGEYRAEMNTIGAEAQKKADEEAKRKNRKTAEEGWQYTSLADHRDTAIVYMYQDIERQIFINSRLSGKSLPDEMENEKKILEKKYLRSVCGVEKKKVAHSPFCKRMAVYTFPNSSVYRFSMAGFDFSVPVEFEKTDGQEERIEPILLTGHANVEMSLFYGNTVSIAYKFFFDGYTASIKDADGEKATKAVTDHIIAFLSCHLGAEFWSEKKKLDSVMTVKADVDGADHCDINFFQKFDITGIRIGKDGSWLPSPESLSCGNIGLNDTEEQSEKRPFNEVMLRYKRFLYKNCTAYKKRLKRREILEHESFRVNNPLSVSLDHHYAMVDIWGDVKHVQEDSDRDIFAENDSLELSEPDIIDHIREYHKPELIGLMTLYPKEWRYRDGKTFDYVCGDSVAIDTDDLVLVGTHVAVVVGTYDRRGAESVGNDWKAMAKVKAKYHVAWPEYLMILQFVLAKKVVIGSMKDRMIRLIEEGKQKSAQDRLFENSKFCLDMTRQILLLDIVKYAKFASHRVMYDRTMERLMVKQDMEEIHDMSEMLTSNLQNVSSYESMRADAWLNIMLALISVGSICEVLFQQPGDLGFWKYLPLISDTPEPGSVLIALNAVIGVVALGVLLYNLAKKFSRKKIA